MIWSSALNRPDSAAGEASDTLRPRPATHLREVADAFDATIETNHGSIQLELFDEEAPQTVANFRTLASEGFYNGLVFHR